MEPDLKFDALVTRMIALARNSTTLDQEAEAIGQDLYALGGIEAMRSALFLFSAAWGDDPVSQISPILPMDWVLAWHNIGGWAS